MKLTVRTPFHARGLVKGSRKEQDILLSRVADRDVPEVGVSETEIALATTHGFDGNGARGEPGVTLRTHGGRLYRPFPLHFGVRDAFDRGVPVGQPLLMTTFSNEAYSRHHGACLSFPAVGRDLPNLAAAPMTGFYDWLLRFGRGKTGNYSRWVGAWPRSGRVFPRWRGTRDDHTLEDVMPFVTSLNAEDFARADAMRQRQLDKLLLVEDELHYACGPPCVVVSVGLHPHSMAAFYNVNLRLSTMPEFMTRDLRTRHYPLGRIDEARAYAARLAGPDAKPPVGSEALLDGLLDDEDRDPFGFGVLADEESKPTRRPAFKFADGACDWIPEFDASDGISEVDTEGDMVWRTGMTTTEAVVRYIEGVPTRAAGLTPDEGMLMATSKAAALRYDPTTEERADFRDILPGIVALWRRLGRPEGQSRYGDFSAIRDWKNTLALDEIVAMADDRPISIHEVAGAEA